MFQSLQKKTVALLGVALTTTGISEKTSAAPTERSNASSLSTRPAEATELSNLRSPGDYVTRFDSSVGASRKSTLASAELDRLMGADINETFDFEAFLKSLGVESTPLDAQAGNQPKVDDILPQTLQLKEEKAAALKKEYGALKKISNENSETIKSLLERRTNARKWIEKKKEDIEALKNELEIIKRFIARHPREKPNPSFGPKSNDTAR